MCKASRKKEQLLRQAPYPGVTARPHRPIPADFFTRPLAALLLIALLASFIYANTFTAYFHFDDYPNIVENPRIKDLKNLFDFSGTRYVGFLSFALNYHFGGLSVFGYHMVNLLIHMTNGFLVYCLVLLLFRVSHSNAQPESGQPHRAAPTQNPQSAPAPWIALATALLFIAHPIQTQAVTYIVQRFASLATLFYLITVVCYLKWRLASSEDRSRYLWYVGALVSTILAMKTKEISFTLPMMLLLIEAIFFRPFTKKRWVALFPFLLTLLIIPFSRVDAIGEAEAGFAQETTEISRSAYLFTQCRVIVTYLRLLFLPINQNLDYDYPIYHSLFELPVLLSFLVLSTLLTLSVSLLFNSKCKTTRLSSSKSHNSQLIAFGILWFFLTLSIESSIIPIHDVIFEHRLYLPSAGLFLAITTSASHPISRPLLRTLSFSLIILVLSATAYQRNFVWEDDISLWEDVVWKAPNKARAHHNLGHGYTGQQRFQEAIREYQTALQLRPDYERAHNNLGYAYKHLGRFEEAAQEYQAALKLKPGFPEAHHNLGDIYEDLGRPEDALREYQTAARLKPDSAEIRNALGNAYAEQKRLEEALREYQAAVRLKPEFAEARNNLGTTYADLGRMDEAIREFQAALNLQPDREEIHFNLGNAYLLKGQTPQAIWSFKRALQIKPDFLPARQALESLSKVKPPHR